MLARDDVDLVSVCTPPFEHSRNTVDALQAGKHVICEKPMAGSLEECDAMIGAARYGNRLLSVVFQRRYSRESLMARALVAEGKLGRIVFGKMDALWWRGPHYYDLWWRGTWEKECGGATINHAVHLFDTYLWLIGQTPESVYADMGTFTHDIEVEDLSVALVRFAGGAIGELTSTVSMHQNLDRIEISGTEAGVSLPWAVSAMTERGRGMGAPDQDRSRELRLWAEEQVPEPDYAGHAAQFRDVLDAIRNGGEPMVTGAEGRRSIELISAVYKSALTRERVGLPITKEDPYYRKVSEVKATQVSGA